IFYQRAIQAPDQLRQRMFFALNQIIVTSGNEPQLNYAARMTGFLQVLLRNALGNFRTLLYEVSRNPGMGRYLDNIENSRNTLNENYAREIMQLFAIGLFQLNQDGTRMLDPDDEPIPTYDQPQIVELTRALTGWELAAPFTLPPAGRSNFRDGLVANDA